MNFVQLPNGMCDGFVILKKCEEKKTKTDKIYLDIVIADKDGEMTGKWWDFNAPGVFEPEMIVKIRGTVEQYNGKDQFRVSQMRPVNASDDVDMSALVPSSDVSGDKLFSMIRQTVVDFEDEQLKQIVLAIIDARKDKLVSHPAAFRLHHAMVGGLMLHTMSMVRLGDAICKIYPNVNRELLLSGAILHDVAKTWELETAPTGLVKGYSTEGELIGHLVKGAMYIADTARELGFDGEKVTLLEHMVLSHHGVPEYGAAVRPMFLEAEILSTIDSLDATIFEINNACSKVGVGEFTDRQWALDNRKLYHHTMGNAEHIVNFDY